MKTQYFTKMHYVAFAFFIAVTFQSYIVHVIYAEDDEADIKNMSTEKLEEKIRENEAIIKAAEDLQAMLEYYMSLSKNDIADFEKDSKFIRSLFIDTLDYLESNDILGILDWPVYSNARYFLIGFNSSTKELEAIANSPTPGSFRFYDLYYKWGPGTTGMNAAIIGLGVIRDRLDIDHWRPLPSGDKERFYSLLGTAIKDEEAFELVWPKEKE